jgi:hypothetical protein
MPIKYNKEALDIEDDIKPLVKQAAKRLCHEVADSLVGASPIWSGSFLASHRVGINKESPEGPTDLKKYSTPNQIYPDQMTDAEAEMLQSKMEMKLHYEIDSGIDRMEKVLGEKIIFTNNIAHADAVEHGAENTPAYAVYGQVLNHIQSFARKKVYTALKKVGGITGAIRITGSKNLNRNEKITG